MVGIKISLNEFLFFINDQDSPKSNNPKIINMFSLKFKLIMFLKKLIKNDQLTLLIITHDHEIAKLFNVKYILKNEKILPLSNYSV